MADDQIVASRSRAVLGRVNLLVCSIHADAQDFDQDPSAARDIFHLRLWDFAQMDRIRLERRKMRVRRREISAAVCHKEAFSPDPVGSSVAKLSP